MSLESKTDKEQFSEYLSKWVHVPGYFGERKVITDKLWRYMPQEACERMVHLGEIRLSSSINFLHESGSRQDDEHNKMLGILASKVLYMRNVRGFKSSIKANKTCDSNTLQEISTNIENPYWIFALTTDFSLHLFDIFEECFAVEIFDAIELLRRLAKNSDQIAGSEFLPGHVDYKDTSIVYGHTNVPIRPLHHKPTKFSSQKEFRCVWHSGEKPASNYKHIDIGPLDDIARVVKRTDVKKEVLFPEDAIKDYSSRGKLLHSQISDDVLSVLQSRSKNKMIDPHEIQQKTKGK